MSEQYRYLPNHPFLQSRPSDIFHKRHGEFFFEVVIFLSFFGKLKKFFFYILSP
ncbi:unnamed protein product, partial [Staurois parvus]